MIVGDTNVWIAYLAGETGADVRALDQAAVSGVLRMAPVVLAEILSAPGFPIGLAEEIAAVPLLELTPGFWSRAGLLRARLIGSGRKPKLADTLIAQSCIDADALLVTRDAGFRVFAEHGLRLR